MRYKKFQITNYKGIKDTVVELPTDGTSATMLIGLNESGKTTILEAIYSFSPDKESEAVVTHDSLLPDDTAKIPRDKLFSFDGDISIVATLEFYPDEKRSILRKIGKEIAGEVDESSVPDTITLSSKITYDNSQKIDEGGMWSLGKTKIRTGKQQKWRSFTSEEWKIIRSHFRNSLPSIAYFPTFLSDIPNRIYLTGHDDDKVNEFYKTIFEDILHQIGPDYSIKSQILDRLKGEGDEGVISQLIAAFWGSSRRNMVQQLVDKAGSVLSKVITDRWNDIFKSRPAGREIVINFGLDESEDGQNIDPYIEFAIKDGANRFNISDRSLGFRWFFCFLLFTQFRAKRQNGVGALFLFDEPASNLHAKAQEKLLESFRDITAIPNRLIYSTHSPYMIDPIWLDHALVVENTLMEGELDSIGQMSISEESNIVAFKYKSYVDLYPDRLNHFQPVLDRLEVKPSLSEISERTLLVEGKSDYAILKGLLEGRKVPFKIVPAHGATTLGGIVGLLRGWGWPFAVLLDSDPEGKSASKKYQEEFDLGERLVGIDDIVAGRKEVEELLDDEDRVKISEHLGVSEKLKKKDIYRFFVDNSGKIRSFKLNASKEVNIRSMIDLFNTSIS